MENKYSFTPEVCECCGQAKTYILPLDKGTAIIVKAIAAAIKIKGVNIIHPKKEMEVPATEWTKERAIRFGSLNSIHIGNLTKARAHGLIARVKDHAGNWCLTKKGAAFLRGEKVPRLAVMQKTAQGSRSHKEEYFRPEEFMVDIYELSEADEMWEGINFDIVEGRVVMDPPVKEYKQDMVMQKLF